MDLRTDLEGGPAHSVGGRRGDGGPQHFLGVSSAGACAVSAAHAFTAVAALTASSQAIPWHISTATGKSGGMRDFRACLRHSLPTRTAISEVVGDDGQNQRHLAERQRGTISGW